MESKTTTIEVDPIEHMGSIKGSTILSSLDITTIISLDVSKSSPPTLEQSIWSSELGFEGLSDVNPGSDLELSDSDTESTCSFYSTCSALTSTESSSPLSSFFDDGTLFNDFETPTPPAKLCLTLSTGSFGNTTSGLDSETSTSSQRSDPNATSTESSYSASPLTSTFSYLRKPQSHVTKPVLRSSCLQCHLLGLRCSLSTKTLLQKTVPKLTSYCSRCLRNGEEFCITQQISEEEETAGKLQFTALGVDILAVKTRAEEMVEAKAEKERFALPKAQASVRLGLRRVFKRWEGDDVEDWSLGSLDLIAED